MKKFQFRPLPAAIVSALAAGMAQPAFCLADEASQETALSTLVITGRRAESRLEDTPQRIEVIDRQDIERTPARELTDLLKKNASVDVIQYPGNLSGIGIRGFRPEYSGINKHTLMLVDGRPALADNLSLFNLDQVERIEVMKGPGSALYGSSAMGGVVNIITRESRGEIKGFAQAGYGSFDTKELKGRVGGKLAANMDFDYSGSLFDQGDDFRIGHGDIRPNTAYRQQNHALRLGVDINPDWRVVTKAEMYRGRDLAQPGDIAYGTSSQTSKDADRLGGDLRLLGRLGDHRLTGVLFSGRQSYRQTTKTTRTAADRPYLPFRSYEQELDWQGAQLQDAWAWSGNASLVFGIDTEEAKAVSRSYNANGTRKAPSAADNSRTSTGIYAENTWSLNDDTTIVYVGARRDEIRIQSFSTPYKTDFTPSTANLSSTNPSAGFKQALGDGWRVHGTVGKAFVAPDALQLTGYAVTAYPTYNVILQGSPGLKPESSVTWDGGVEWSNGKLFADVTVFSTQVKDRITKDAGVTLPNGDKVTTYINASSAEMEGVELEGRWQFRPGLRLSLAGTQFFHATEKTGSREADANNVAKYTVRLGLDAEYGAWSGRLSGRYVGRTKDQDWVNDSTRQVQYAGFAVWDVSARYRIDPRQSLSAAINNLLDRQYAEKFGYPLPGRNILAAYRYDF